MRCFLTQAWVRCYNIVVVLTEYAKLSPDELSCESITCLKEIVIMSFIPVRSFTNYIDAHILLGRLKDEGLNCWLRNEATTTIIPIWTTALGGIEVMVAQKELQKAQHVLTKIAEEKKVSRICPQCFSHDVEYINTMRKPVNWLSAAITFFLGDFAIMPEQRYHCFHCSAEFEKPLEASNN